MLSDHEQARLQEIQHQFLAEDPDFVRTLDACAQRLSSASPARAESRRPYTILMWINTTLSLLLLLAGSVGGALLLAGVAGALALTRWAAGDTAQPI